jgi:hypothetical protein
MQLPFSPKSRENEASIRGIINATYNYLVSEYKKIGAENKLVCFYYLPVFIMIFNLNPNWNYWNQSTSYIVNNQHLE